MDNNNYEPVLTHHGVKGMRWGVRRSKEQLGRSRGRRSSKSEDYTEARKIKKKKVSQMSNAELKKINERTRLEQEYSRLNPSAVSKGWKFVAGTAGIMGTTIALYNNSNTLIGIGKKFVGK